MSNLTQASRGSQAGSALRASLCSNNCGCLSDWQGSLALGRTVYGRISKKDHFPGKGISSIGRTENAWPLPRSQPLRAAWVSGPGSPMGTTDGGTGTPAAPRLRNCRPGWYLAPPRLALLGRRQRPIARSFFLRSQQPVASPPASAPLPPVTWVARATCYWLHVNRPP